MKSAVGVYNNPSITFKTEIYITNAIISWTYLFHAYYEKLGIDYHFCRITLNGRKRYIKVNGRNKAWDISKCLASNESPLSDPQKNNLLFLIQIRNLIEHTSIVDIDDLVSSQIMACSINFNTQVKKLFGEKYSLDKELGIAIQFSSLNPAQKRVMKSKTNNNVSKFISEFESKLDKRMVESEEYSFRVAFIPIVVNREGQANRAITVFKTDAPETEVLNYYIKETEKPKFRPKEIVAKMKEKGFSDFTISKHTDMWKAKDAKNRSLNFGTEVSGTWYWYESWLIKVEEELINQRIKQVL
jgi:hypothetical protein